MCYSGKFCNSKIAFDDDRPIVTHNLVDYIAYGVFRVNIRLMNIIDLVISIVE